MLNINATSKLSGAARRMNSWNSWTCGFGHGFESMDRDVVPCTESAVQGNDLIRTTKMESGNFQYPVQG